MTSSVLDPEMASRLARLYEDMAAAYARTAHDLNFSCQDCPDNCCDSYFQHHTYIEWAYLWLGLNTLTPAQRQLYQERAAAWSEESHKILARAERPTLMCPLNENGLCALYPYRLMICRLHGVPSTFTRPDGKSITSPGCFRCQILTARQEPATQPLDRTAFYSRLRDLELELLAAGNKPLPRIKMTLAAMISQEPPVQFR